MQKHHIRKILDFLPLGVLVILLIDLIHVRISQQILFTWRHWLAIFFFVLNCVAFLKKHQLGVLVLGFTLLFGMMGVTLYSPGVNITTVYWSAFGARIPVFYGMPAFLIWLIIHFIVSGRFYVAILTKGYWEQLLASLKEAGDSRLSVNSGMRCRFSRKEKKR